MGDKKKLSQGLTEKQELQRQETINKVLWAVADIKSERGKITISTLAEYTGLSRSTFVKSHIWELLVEHGYASRDIAAVPHKRKKANQVEIIAENNRQIAELRAKNAELEQECELLRGRLSLLMEKNN